MKALRPAEYRARWSEADERDGRVQLLDVREDWELEASALPNALHVPMQQVPESLDRLDRDRPLVVMCRSGGRSAQVVAFLEREGYVDVYNLSGGINAWSEEVDPDVPAY